VMAPSRRKKASAAAAEAAAAQWKVGDLVLAKMKGFPAWPAMVPIPSAFVNFSNLLFCFSWLALSLLIFTWTFRW
jgi:PWWP domain